MPVIPWKMAEAPVAGNRYLALISYLPLKHFRAIPNFFRFTSEIRRSREPFGPYRYGATSNH